MGNYILMIGGTGLIGPGVLAGLRELSPETEVFMLNRHGMAPEGATAFPGDRRDPKALRAALEAARPNVLIDMTSTRSRMQRSRRRRSAGSKIR